MAEQMYGLRYAVYGHKLLHHLCLTQPALRFLRVGKLYPYGVYAVCRVDSHLGHHYAVAPA